MNAKLVFRSPVFRGVVYKKINCSQFFSSLHSEAAYVSIEKFSEKRGKNSELRGSIYVRSLEIADSIASCIAEEYNGGYLFEANAGPGILSHSFLKNGINHLRVFEKNKEFVPALEILCADYPNLQIVQQDLMMIPSLEFKRDYEAEDPSTYTKEYFESIFKDIPIQTWESDVSFQIFALIASKRSHKFLRYLLPAVPKQATPFCFGRCDLFLLISETEFWCMNALPKENFSMYRWSTVLYNLFFEMKCLQKFSTDGENFFFCNTSRGRKKISHFYLVKLTPRRDLFQPPMTPERLQEFFFFVRSNLVKRSDLVIRSIEKWMPYCGPRLIREGFNVFIRFGDLSPKEILRLFQHVASWSEYRDCYSEALACKFDRRKTTAAIEEDSGSGVE